MCRWERNGRKTPETKGETKGNAKQAKNNNNVLQKYLFNTLFEIQNLATIYEYGRGNATKKSASKWKERKNKKKKTMTTTK